MENKIKNYLLDSLKKSVVTISVFATLTGCVSKIGVNQKYNLNLSGTNVIHSTLRDQAIHLDRVTRGVENLEEKLKSGKVSFSSKNELLGALAQNGIDYEVIDSGKTYAKIAVSGAINGFLIYYTLKGLSNGGSSGGGSSGSVSSGGTGYSGGSIEGGNVLYIPK